AGVHNRRDRLGEGFQNGGDNLRERRHQIFDNFRQGLNQSGQQVESCLDNEGQAFQKGGNDSFDNLGQNGDNGFQNFRQCGDQRGQKLDAGVNDLRNSRHQKFYNAGDDSGQGRDEYRQCVENTLCQPGNELQGCVQDKGQVGDKSLANLGHHLHNGGNQLGQRRCDTGSQ